MATAFSCASDILSEGVNRNDFCLSFGPWVSNRFLLEAVSSVASSFVEIGRSVLERH